MIDLMLDDLRREVGECPRMLLAARVRVGYFNRLIARRLLRARMAQTSFFRFIWALLLRNPWIQHHQIHRSNRYNNNVLLYTNHIRRHPYTALAVRTKRVLQVADYLRVSFRIGSR